VTTLSGALPAGSVSAGGAYPSTTLAASGGTAPYTCLVTSGALPTGLNLSGSGTISGSPTTAGTFNFTVTVTDSATPAHTATGNLSLVINGILTVSTSGTLSATGEAGGAYSATLAQTGGVGPFTWVLKTGSLPGGLTLSSTGTISGTISASAVPGNFSFTVQVTDAQGNVVVSGTLTIKVDAALAITPPALSVGGVNVNYTSAAFTASGGSGTGYTFAVASGSLPSPLTIGASTGIISGIPAGAGTSTFAVKVTDSLRFTATTGNLTITINPAITVGLSPTSPVTLDQGLTQLITATVTNDPSGAGVAWALTSGLGSLTGQASTTTVTYNAPTTVTVASTAVVTATSKTDPTKSATFTINLVPPPSITTTTLPAGTVSFAYTGTVSMTGGVRPYTWVLVAGPAGVSLGSSTTNTISVQGTPTTAGANQTFTIKVTDAQGLSVTSSGLTITVLPAPVITGFTPVAATITAGTSTNLTATFSNGTGSVNNGVGAVVSGTPVPVTPAATTTYTLTVTNTAGASVTATATVTVIPLPVITSFAPAALTITSGTSTTLTATFSGGTGSVNNGVVGPVTSGTPVSTGTLTTTTTYTLTVTNSATTPASVTATATVTVVATPAITSFAPALTPIVAGNSTTLTAVFTGGTGIVNNGVGPVVSGTLVTVTPSVTTTYTLTVTNAATTPASVTATTTVTVDTPPQITSANHVTFSVGVFSTFMVTTTGFPIPAINDGGAVPPPAGLTFTDNGNGTATLSGTPAAGSGGTYPFTITAINAVTPNATQSFTLTVNTAPGFTSANNTTFTVGTAGTFTVTAVGTPTPTLAKTTGTLPNNVTLTDNGNGTATLAGTPAAGTGGQYSITITATNTAGPTNQTFTLTVDQAPLITTANNATFTEGTFSSFTVMTTGFPKPALSDGSPTLPTGVTFTDNGDGTATLKGTPAAGTSSASPYAFTITASNGVGTNGTQTFTLTVNAVPVFSSATSTTFTVGATGSFNVTATGSPTFSVSTTINGTLPNGNSCTGNGCLPSGVTLSSGGSLTGTPATNTGGVYNFTVNAVNGSGTTTQSFALTVDQAPFFQSNNSATFVVGQNGTFNVNVGGFPMSTMTIQESGTLPGTVTFTDNGNGGGTLSGTPSGTAQNYSITFTANNGVGSPSVQTFTLTVISDPCTGASTGNESLLSGQYAWLTSGFDNGQGSGETQAEPALVGGVLTFNGSGAITAGTLDENLYNTQGISSLSVTGGTYKVGTDRRACLDITTSQGIVHYRVTLNGAGNIGHVIDFDPAGPFTSGLMKKQTMPFPTSVSGNFAFELAAPQNTVASAGGQSAVSGAITFSSNTITGGEEDINDEGQLEGSSLITTWPSTAPITITGGSLNISSTSGRGTITVTGSASGSPFSSSSVTYDVSPSDIFIMSNFDQTQTGGLFAAGEALKQSGSFSLGSLDGTSVTYNSSLSLNSGVGSSNPPTSNAQIGVVTANGAGAFTSGTMYKLQGGNTCSSGCNGPSLSLDTFGSGSVTYSTPDSFGRVLLITGDTNSPLLYLVGTNEAFLLGSSSEVEIGMFEPQTSTSTPSGTFAFGEIDQASDNGINDGVATFSSGTVSVTSDNNGPSGSGGLQPDQTFNNLNVSAGASGLEMISGNSSACQIQITSDATVSNPCQLIFYIINSGRAALLNISNGQGTSVPQNPNLQTADQ